MYLRIVTPAKVCGYYFIELGEKAQKSGQISQLLITQAS